MKLFENQQIIQNQKELSKFWELYLRTIQNTVLACRRFLSFIIIHPSPSPHSLPSLYYFLSHRLFLLQYLLSQFHYRFLFRYQLPNLPLFLEIPKRSIIRYLIMIKSVPKSLFLALDTDKLCLTKQVRLFLKENK